MQPAAPLSDPTPDELLGNLNEYTGGIWYDDPRALEKLSTYLSQKDVFIDPKFQQEKLKAQKVFDLRLDSRGEILKRAILGDRNTYQTIVLKS